MNTPRRALECVQDARTGGTLRAPDWDLIEQYLIALDARGIHEPDEITDRLERRGGYSEDSEGLVYSCSPRGRRQGMDAR